jgi:hypothetical protein
MQGCRMVYFYTKNSQFGYNLKGLILGIRNFLYLNFTTVCFYRPLVFLFDIGMYRNWFILRLFGNFLPILVRRTKKNLADLYLCRWQQLPSSNSRKPI